MTRSTNAGKMVLTRCARNARRCVGKRHRIDKRRAHRRERHSTNQALRTGRERLRCRAMTGWDVA